MIITLLKWVKAWMQKKACMHVPVSIAACLALPEKSLSHNQGHPNFSPHSSLSLSGLTSLSIILDTELSSHGKPLKCANRMPITISKRDLIKMTVCVLTEAPWPPRVLDASRHGLNGASVAEHDRWPLSAAASFLHEEPNIQLSALWVE